MTSRNVVRALAWALALAIIVVSVVPPDLRPNTETPHLLEHFCIYLLLGGAFSIGHPQIRTLLAVLFTVFAGAIEAIQLLVPGRHARLSDFVVDAVGAYVGLLLVVLAARRRRSAFSRSGRITDRVE